ncbi:hypothetical protein Vafri_12193 [Volvox africanus]|uniref:Uncharacterized protein n=1 Tax=Volvox africanus TaxID=51714 RepID=A0A8J4BAH2_9CHLO|nr:hypothetical protein Vafri_12193 [Volvox africanus]
MALSRTLRCCCLSVSTSVPLTHVILSPFLHFTIHAAIYSLTTTPISFQHRMVPRIATLVDLKNATNAPIRLDLLPRYPGVAAVPLNPPLNFRGTFGFTVPFDYLRVGAWDPDNDHMNFIQSLQKGLLYVSVQTVGMPGGALQGKLECKPPCMFSIGGGGVVYPGK